VSAPGEPLVPIDAITCPVVGCAGWANIDQTDDGYECSMGHSFSVRDGAEVEAEEDELYDETGVL
jgi:hypothetical protein